MAVLKLKELLYQITLGTLYTLSFQDLVDSYKEYRIDEKYKEICVHLRNAIKLVDPLYLRYANFYLNTGTA